MEWALPFQLFAGVTLSENMLTKTKKKILFVERSPFSSYKCFSELLHKNGTLNDSKFEILSRCYNIINQNIPQPSHFVYLYTTPETSYKRLQERARTEEEVVSLDYLKQLHDQHELVFRNHTNVFFLNGEANKIDVFNNCWYMIKNIVQNYKLM